MELNMKNLENCFNSALKNKAKYVAVKLQTRLSEKCELMITPYENIPSKLRNYKEGFNEDLTFKNYDGIKIVGFTFANTLNEIENDLCFE